jgi:hypothetical protein
VTVGTQSVAEQQLGGRGGGDEDVDSHDRENVSVVVSMESVIILGGEDDLLGGEVREGGRGD